MNWLRRLKIQSFRVLGNVDVELRPLNVIIGANGSGKTSVLDTLSFLAVSANRGLIDLVSQMGGFNGLLTYGASHLAITVDAEDALSYSVVLVPSSGVYAIESEALIAAATEPHVHLIQSRGGETRYRRDSGGLVTISSNWRPNESALGQAPTDIGSVETFRQRLTAQTYYRVFSAGPKAIVRQPQQLQPGLLPGKEGESLASCLYNMRESHPERFEAVEDTLRTAFPYFDRLQWPTVAAGLVVLEWWDKRWQKPFYPSQLSEGTLRFLWLVALLQSPQLPMVTLIDEPEVSLHPELLSLLADLLREASTRSQIVVATQSDRLVRFLKPEEVLVADSGENGVATLRWAETFDIDKWLQDFTLDEVWTMGRLTNQS
jgi:predicted ATPase